MKEKEASFVVCRSTGAIFLAKEGAITKGTRKTNNRKRHFSNKSSINAARHCSGFPRAVMDCNGSIWRGDVARETGTGLLLYCRQSRLPAWRLGNCRESTYMVNRRNEINPPRKYSEIIIWQNSGNDWSSLRKYARKNVIKNKYFFQILYKLTFADIKQYVYKLIKLIIDSSLYTLE